MFELWQLEGKNKATSTPVFRLRDEPSVDGSHVHFNYSYERLEDRSSRVSSRVLTGR